MSNVFGKNISFTIFGESHGEAIGGVLGNLPSGHKIDFEKIDRDLQRRNKKAFYSTPRGEDDKYELLSGVKDGVVTGAPLSFIIRNKDTKSSDYSILSEVMRPGHSDYPAFVKYKGFNDVRGGGHFSGRITAPLVFAGSLIKQYLEKENIKIFSHILSIGDVKGKSVLEAMPDEKTIEALQGSEFGVIDHGLKPLMEQEIKKYQGQKNSVGGVIECCILNMPAGIGEPFFDSMESHLARVLFSIPAVKGVEFGRGFDITKMQGSAANDNYYYEGGSVKAKTNNNGGILGGITNGMPIVIRVAVKPTPSIFLPQETINVKTKENEILTLSGRHDACIVPRAATVVECSAALGIFDMMGGR